jgi:cytochrome c oxidase cbb3-type subunit 3
MSLRVAKNVVGALVFTAAAAAAVAVHVGAQGPPQGEKPAPPQQPGGRGQGRAVFPAQQRPPGDPAIIERGRTLYSVTCSACHGVDLRGGQLGGPNLLRSQLVLNDKDGELIVPVIQNGRPDKGMPPMPISPEDGKAVAVYLHSVLASAGRQGSPPPADIPELTILVGDAAAGQAFFEAKCAACHSTTGDLQGIATRISDPKVLQNLWVSGGTAGARGRGRRGGGGAGGAGGPNPRQVTVTVTLPSGEAVQGPLARIDDFLVVVLQEDGTLRSFRRDGDQPKVEIHDPLKGHRDLLLVYRDKDMHDVTAFLATLK